MPRRWRCIGRPVELHEGSERREKEGSGTAGPSDEVHAAMDISGDAGLTDSAISIKTWNLRAQSHGKKAKRVRYPHIFLLRMEAY